MVPTQHDCCSTICGMNAVAASSSYRTASSTRTPAMPAERRDQVQWSRPSKNWLQRDTAYISCPARNGSPGAACSNVAVCGSTTRKAVRCIRCAVFSSLCSSGGRRRSTGVSPVEVAREVADYQRSGIAVDGIVGIGASPSCGVMTTLDLRTSLEVVASCPAAALTRDVMNEQAVLGCRRAGEGLFVQALDRELKRHRLTVPAMEHDLATELRGDRQALLAVKPPRTLAAHLLPEITQLWRRDRAIRPVAHSP